MKVTLFLCLLVAGSQASFWDDLKSAASGVGQAFTDTAHQVGSQLKVVGGQLLETAKTQGSQLASQALQSLLLGTMNALTSGSSSSKRQLSSLVDQFSQVQHVAQSFIHDKTDAAHQVFNAAVDKLHELQQTHPDDLVAQVNSVLQNHHVLSQTFKHDLVEGLHNMFQHAFKTDSQKRSFKDDVQQVLHQLGVNFEATFGHHFGKVDELLHNFGQNILAHNSVAPEN